MKKELCPSCRVKRGRRRPTRFYKLGEKECPDCGKKWGGFELVHELVKKQKAKG